MDRKELITALDNFRERCAQQGRPIVEMCAEDAFVGDASTSYIIQVKAPWIDNTSCSEAIDFLFDILWETTDERIRKSVFSIQVIDSNDQLHCWSEQEPALA